MNGPILNFKFKRLGILLFIEVNINKYFPSAYYNIKCLILFYNLMQYIDKNIKIKPYYNIFWNNIFGEKFTKT